MFMLKPKLRSHQFFIGYAFVLIWDFPEFFCNIFLGGRTDNGYAFFIYTDEIYEVLFVSINVVLNIFVLFSLIQRIPFLTIVM